MAAPKPTVTEAPLPTEIDPKAQTAADETARKARERQQAGVTATKTILTSGLDDEATIKKGNLGA